LPSEVSQRPENRTLWSRADAVWGSLMSSFDCASAPDFASSAGTAPKHVKDTVNNKIPEIKYFFILFPFLLLLS